MYAIYFASFVIKILFKFMLLCYAKVKQKYKKANNFNLFQQNIITLSILLDLDFLALSFYSKN